MCHFCLHNIIISILLILQVAGCTLIKLIEANNYAVSLILIVYFLSSSSSPSSSRLSLSLLSMYNRCIVQDQHPHSTVADATKICVNIDVYTYIYVYSKIQMSAHLEMCVKNLSMYEWCM